jgi:hypothetical protein
VPDELIPEDVRQFILQRIGSIAELEALLLLRREPETIWTAAKAAERLYVEDSAAKEVLDRLCAEGLIGDGGGSYRFKPEPREQAELIDRLADLYSRHLIPVTNLVHAKPSGIRAFANAFRLRKDR